MHTNPAIARRLTSLSRIAIASGGLVALASVFGWLFDLPMLVAIHPNVVGMSLVTAIGLLLAAIGASLLHGAPTPGTGHLRAALGLAIGGLATFKLLDGHVFPELRGVLAAPLGPGDVYPTAMSDYTALALLLLGLSLAASRRGGALADAAHALALAGIAIPLFVLIGYVYDVQSIVHGTANFPMAFNTVVASALVGLGQIFARPHTGPLRILVLDTPGGHLLRGLLPAFIVLPFFLGWLRLQGERAGLIEPWFGVALMTSLMAASFIGLTCWNAYALDRKDAERARAEAATRRREEEYRALAEHSPDVISRFDAARRRLYVNPAIEAVTGLPPAAVIGRTNEELGFAPSQAAAWNAFVDGAFASGETRVAEFAYQGPDGVERVFQARIVPERGPDQRVSSVLVVARDISELRRAYDALAEADRHKDEFLAVASHELRTPLNAILGYVGFLQEGIGGDLTPAQQDFADKAMKGVDRLRALIEDVVEYTRLVSGRLALDPAPTDFQELVEAAVAPYRPLAEDREIALEVDVRVEGLPRLDAYRIAQVIGKLVDNGLKFTPKGGRLTVRGRRWADGLVTEVADTGIGVEASERERIFAPFRQADMSSTRAAGGLGLGLPISRGIVEAHGGDIGVYSSPGAGSTFWFALPAFSGPEEPARPDRPGRRTGERGAG